MFSQDRNLLSLEPAVFSRYYWPQQTLVAGTAYVSGTTLTAADVNFTAAGVKPGHVVVLEGVTPYEIVAVPSATALTISLVRISPDDPALPPAPLSGANFRILTFDPQHADLERVILARLGCSAEAARDLEAREILTLASACGVLAAVYRAGSIGSLAQTSGVVNDDWPAIKAKLYDTYFRALLRLVRPVPVLSRG